MQIRLSLLALPERSLFMKSVGQLLWYLDFEDNPHNNPVWLATAGTNVAFEIVKILKASVLLH